MNNQEMQELLVRVDRSPGTATQPELLAAQEFYRNFNKRLGIFRSVHNRDPIGLTVEAKLEDIEFYIKVKK